MPRNDQNDGGNGGWQGGGGGQGPWGQSPSGGGGQQPPDLEELIRKGQETLRNFMPGGGGGGGAAMGGAGSRGVWILAALVLLGFLAYGSVYRVNADEQGVVLRFGNYAYSTPPGLHFKLPYPIETVLTPRVTSVNQINIGIPSAVRGNERNARSISLSEAQKEGQMLTGDENIVDINFSVFWKINDAADYLFNVDDPEGAVKAVAESVMREVVGQTEFQVLQTTGRLQAQGAVQARMQTIMDGYGAGILITEVKLAKVDPPAAVIDAFRDVQAARADQERLRNEAEAYANTVVPQARGESEVLIQAASAYREQTVAQAQGESERFLSIYNEYKEAKDVTRQRMFLETMERVFGGMNKILMDQGANGAVPYLPLNQLVPGSTSRNGEQR